MAEKVLDFAHEATFFGECAIPRAGKTPPLVIDFEFAYFDKEQFEQFLKAIPDKQDVEVLEEITRGWTNVEMDYSRETLQLLLDNNTNAALAILNYWLSEHRKAAEKN